MSQQVIFRRKQRSGPMPALTPGKPYDVIDRGERYGYEKVLITNDSGKNTWYHLDDFETEERASSAEPSFPILDLSGLSEEQKDIVVKGAMADIVKATMHLFYSLGLSTHLDQMAFNDVNGDEFLLSFRKVQGDELLGPALRPIRPSQTAELSGNSEQLPEPKPSDEYKHCNHHHELTANHEVVDFGDGEFVANKMAIPLLKALNDAGLRTRSHHIDTHGQGWVTILLDNVEFEFRKVWEIHADRKKYNGKPELYISWGLRPDIPHSEIE